MIEPRSTRLYIPGYLASGAGGTLVGTARWIDATWCAPELTVDVRFLEWTPFGTLRHASLVRLPTGE